MAMLVACSADPTVVTPVPTVPTVATPATGGDRTVFTTRDAVELVGDVYPGEPGAPAVLLLHMTPTGGATRVDWPGVFVDRLVDDGWWVVALDRRGAGESGGDGTDAFVGEAGRYDAEAVAVWLEGAGAGDLAILGASNGTTTALDYATWAPTEGLPVPVALGFLTGGTYTENQTAVTAWTGPAVFTYSTGERAWSAALEDAAPASWVFHEYPDGAHGTRMFDAAPAVTDDLAAFLQSVR
jgi:pimeloyl-ACP methyl ester carboxylesterase